MLLTNLAFIYINLAFVWTFNLRAISKEEYDSKFEFISADFSVYDNQHRPKYEWYEKCLYGLSKSKWDLEADVYRQPACVAALGMTEEDLNDIKRLHNRHQDGREYPESFMDVLPNPCMVGIDRHQLPLMPGSPKDISQLFHANDTKCMTRSVNDRPWGRQWRFIADRRLLEEVAGGSARSLVAAVRAAGSSELVMVGDSITHQTYHFLTCDAIRNDVKIYFSDYFDDDQLKIKWHNRLRMWLPGTEDPVLLRKERLVWPGSYDEDERRDFERVEIPIEERLARFRQQLAEYARVADRSADEKIVMLVNFGVHSHERFDTIPAAVKVLLEFAHQHRRNTMIIFRGTLAQHFGYTYDGSFTNDPGCPVLRNPSDLSGMCCDKPRYDRRYKAEKYFLKAFEEEDPQWRKLIGFVDTQPLTAPLHDLHVENFPENDRVFDCLHFLYTPHLLGPVWKGIDDEISVMKEHLWT